MPESPGGQPASPFRLQAVGVDPLAEQVYAELLRGRSSSARAIARLLGVDRSHVARALTDLVDAGLAQAARADAPGYVSGTGVRPFGAEERYVARPPGAALGPELRRRVAELVRAGAAIDRLDELHARRGEGAARPEPVTVVTGFAAVEAATRDVLAATTTELLALDRQPFVRSAEPDALPSAMFDLLRRGAQARTIYAVDAFRVAGYGEYIAEAARLGEQSRLVAHLPLRFTVADRATAMLPLESEGPWVSAALVVHGRALVDDLVQTFEELWDHAPPRSSRLSAADVGDELDDVEMAMLRMLAHDLTEGAIGRHVGLSARTVGRRLGRLQDKLGARNRFGLGVEASRRGLV